MSKCYLEERKEIIDRMWKIIGDKDFSQVRVAERLGYSKSKVSRVLSMDTPVDLDFIYTFARVFCSNDIIYLLTGKSGTIDNFTTKVLDGVPFKEQQQFCDDLLKIAQIIKK